MKTALQSIVVCLALVGIWFIATSLSGASRAGKHGAEVTAVAAVAPSRPIPAPTILPLGAALIVVKPGQSMQIPFAVRPKAEGETFVEGKYVAIGGAGNDITALLLDDDSYVNWVNHHPSQSLFQHIRESAATIKAGPLDPGVYHLVFDNRFSVFSQKVIQNTLQIRFQPN
jgi:hypothetical protein